MALSDAEVISLFVIFSILVGACLWLLCGLENTEDSGTGVYICIFIHVFFQRQILSNLYFRQISIIINA